MVTAICLLLLAIFFLGLELLLPSAGLLTVVGLGCVIGWIGAAFVYGGPLAGGAAMIITIVLAPILFVAATRWWPTTSVGRAMLIGDVQPDRVTPWQSERTSLVGRTGRTLSRMLPSGAIEIDGQTYDAITEGMPLEAGVDIRVVALIGNSLVVSNLHGNATAPQTDTHHHHPSDVPLDTWVTDPFDDPLP